jgi:fatty acid desaturase
LANPEEFRRPDNILFVKIAAIYGFTLACIYVVSAQQLFSAYFFVTSAFSWALIGWCQFALFNALHEGLHKRFGQPHREFFAYALTAWPVGFGESYRKVHMDHHKYFGEPDRDPDYANYANFPNSRREFLRRLLLNLSGIMAVIQFFGMRQQAAGSDNTHRDSSFLQIVICQVLILLAFTATVGWYYYIWLWLIPLVTFGKFFSSTRTFCEHASPDNQPIIRTITGSFLGEKIFGVFCFHYHAEHHRYVFIPCNQLEAVHRELASTIYQERDNRGARYEHYPNGYLQLLGSWFKALPR